MISFSTPNSEGTVPENRLLSTRTKDCETHTWTMKEMKLVKRELTQFDANHTRQISNLCGKCTAKFVVGFV